MLILVDINNFLTNFNCTDSKRLKQATSKLVRHCQKVDQLVQLPSIIVNTIFIIHGYGMIHIEIVLKLRFI